MSTRPPCRYYAASGLCYFGDSCNFAHIDSGGGAPAAAPPAAAPAPAPSTIKIVDPVNKQTILSAPRSAAVPFQPASAPAPHPSPHAQQPRVAAYGAAGPAQSRLQYVDTGATPPPQRFAPGQVASPYEETAEGGVVNMPGARMAESSLFVSEHLRELLSRKQQLVLRSVGDDPRFADIPSAVEEYHTLYPLEDADASRDKGSAPRAFGFPTSVYKAISAATGLPVALRKIEGFRLQNEYAMSAFDRWRKIRHPGLVTVSDVFLSSAFSVGDIVSLFFATEYMPGAITLESYCMSGAGRVMQEAIFFNYALQLIAVVRAAHSNGLAVRSLFPSKVLVTGNHRLRVAGAGVVDVLQFQGPKPVEQLQTEDLVQLGRLLMDMALDHPAAHLNPAASLELIAQRYSGVVCDLLHYLTLQVPSLDGLLPLVAGQLLDFASPFQTYSDYLEIELQKEAENGRLFRLISKLGFINERPEFAHDPSWSETGDRYLLALFRDYLFHQVNENGKPVLNLGHVVDTLNKLDCGSDERIMLLDRNEKNILVVSYKDLRNCIDTAIGELGSRK